MASEQWTEEGTGEAGAGEGSREGSREGDGVGTGTAIQGAAAVSSGENTDDADRAVDDAIGAELRQVGDRLAAAIRAAVGTDEAEALRGEVRAGIRRMREEFEEALEKAPRPPWSKSTSGDDAAESADSADSESGSRRSTLRKDIARALRTWAERAASTIEPTADESVASTDQIGDDSDPWGSQ